MAFMSPAAMAKAQREAEAKSMKALQDRREQTRKEFFKGREDVSPNRLDRRQIQADLYEQFKSDPTKTKKVAGNLYQAAQPGGMTLAQYNEELAKRYGPTLSEIGGDIRYGLGNILQGFAEKGSPIISLFRGLGEKFKSGVEKAWDVVRGEPQAQVTGTQFPQPSSDMKNYFSSMGIDTGVPQVANEDMLVQIAKQNQYEKIPFNELIEGATAENIPQKIIDTAADITLNPIVSVDSPMGEIRVNRLTGDIVTGGGLGDLGYMLRGNPLSNNYGIGLNYGLGDGFALESGYSSGMNAPDVGIGYGVNLPYGGYGLGAGTNLGTGESSVGGNINLKPFRYFYPTSAGFDPTISLGARLSDQQELQPQFSLNFGYNKGGSVNKHSGLGYMFK